MINRKQLTLVVLFFIGLAPALVLAGIIDLPVTGQTKCYNMNGAAITCTGTGQDGDVRAGVLWPVPRFTNLDGSAPINGDCILDRLTGLIWPRNANHGYMNWYQAMDYANTFTLCGLSGWNLPNINQMESLVNANESGPAAWLNSQGFYNAQSGYWSSTTYAYNITYAWWIYMSGGNVYYSGLKSNYSYVWPVYSAQQSNPDPQYPANLWKTGQKISYYPGDDGDLQRGVAWPDPRFKDNWDGTVTDDLTGLMWLKNANCIATQYPAYGPNGNVTRDQSLNFVKGINNGTYLNCGAGYYDWRLPNRKELMSLVDRSNSSYALPDGYLFMNVGLMYFTSTTSARFTNLPWYINMVNGYTNVWQNYDKFVWPVRGGYVGAAVSYYCDKDNDTYRSPIMEGTCTGIGCVPAGCLTTPGNDCNDNDYTVNPGKTEGFWGDATCADGKDNNCNGLTDAADAVCQTVNADLVIAVVSGPETGVPGSIITIGDTTKNNGPGSAPASSTKFYWSTNNSWDEGDAYLGARPVPVLASGASNKGTITVTVPSNSCSGSFYIIARADADNLIAETKETNNTMSKSIKTGSDLTVYSLTAPALSGEGKTITVTDKTRNQGGCTAGASITRLYFSTNSTWDAADTYLGERSIPQLSPGLTDTGSTFVTIPAVTPKYYYIIAKADADSAVAELLEANNYMSKTIKIGPDLIALTLTAPTSAAMGSTITITESVRNDGGGDAGASTTRLYLSTNSTWDAGDTYLGERVVPALAAGVTSSGSTNVAIPSGITAGTYNIIELLDAGLAVAETSETNNNRYRLITINP
ncbi:MAG: DUF1566 domain-containing protein [Nitrospirae bacterium]|nr:DUF1566 domain-containing protein [Nitrospirota bacterium]